MRRVFLAVAIVVAAVLAAGPAFAQVKAPTVRLQAAPVIRAPIIRIIPPSMIVKQIRLAFPAAKVLSIKPPGPGGKHYVVKLKNGKEIVQTRVDAVTGAMVPP